MSRVPSRHARLAHAAKHADLWNAGKKDEWVASWRTICPGEVRMFDPVGTAEKAWVCESHFGTEPNVQMAYSIETFAWDDDGKLLIKSYYPMPESVDADSDPYAHLLGKHQ
jgi:hypothetical protein